MQKQPFTQSGLQDLLLDLYALSDSLLAEEAGALRHQPRLWINGHFDLTQDQLDYLQNMPTQLIQFIAEDGSFAISHRLPVTLSKGEKGGDDEQDKLFKTNSSLNIQTNNEGNIIAGGQLGIEITYIEQQT